MILVSSCSCLCAVYWSQVISRVWRCSWSSADRRCSNYVWVINNFIVYKGASYIRGLTVALLYDYCMTYSLSYGPNISANLRADVEQLQFMCCCHGNPAVSSTNFGFRCVALLTERFFRGISMLCTDFYTLSFCHGWYYPILPCGFPGLYRSGRIWNSNIQTLDWVYAVS